MIVRDIWNEWISTSDQLPAVDVMVIVTNGKYVTVGELASYGQWRVLKGLGVVESTDYLDVNAVTHWMPLPALPDVDSALSAGIS